MLVSAIAGAEMAMRDVGAGVPFGSGVAAAQAYYAETASSPPALTAAAE